MEQKYPVSTVEESKVSIWCCVVPFSLHEACPYDGVCLRSSSPWKRCHKTRCCCWWGVCSGGPPRPPGCSWLPSRSFSPRGCPPTGCCSPPCLWLPSYETFAQKYEKLSRRGNESSLESARCEDPKTKRKVRWRKKKVGAHKRRSWAELIVHLCVARMFLKQQLLPARDSSCSSPEWRDTKLHLTNKPRRSAPTSDTWPPPGEIICADRRRRLRGKCYCHVTSLKTNSEAHHRGWWRRWWWGWVLFLLSAVPGAEMCLHYNIGGRKLCHLWEWRLFHILLLSRMPFYWCLL